MAFEMKGQGFKTGGGFSAGGGFSMAGEAPDDPLEDVEYTDSLAADAAAENAALQSGFADRAKKEKDRFKNAVDTEFWFAVCFKTREDKEAFLNAMKLTKTMFGDKYIDGHKWARAMGISLE